MRVQRRSGARQRSEERSTQREPHSASRGNGAGAHTADSQGASGCVSLTKGHQGDDDSAMSTVDRNVPVSIIGRVSIIFDCFSHLDSTLTVSEIARRTGLAKSTTSRLVAELTSHGFLESHGSSISLGLRFFELGQKSVRPHTLRRLTYAHMEGLRRTTGHTVHLAVLDAGQVVYIEILPSRSSPAMPSRVGGRLPAHATAVGKAILAFSNPAITERHIAAGLETVGPRTITDPDMLRAALWRVRSMGFATEREESGPNVACVAAPILVRDGEPIAGISVSGWIHNIDLEACMTALRSASELLKQQVERLPPSRQAL